MPPVRITVNHRSRTNSTVRVCIHDLTTAPCIYCTDSGPRPTCTSVENYLRGLMQFLTDELLTFKLGDLAPNPLPKLAPYPDVKSLAAAYIQLLSKLLGKSFSRIVKHEARLFLDEFVAPTQTLNDLLCLAMQSVHPDAEPGAWDAQEQVELQRVVQLVQSGKLESQEYCKLWEFFLVVLNEVKHALQAGQVWGVWDPVKQKEWFWKEMERVTGKDSIEGLQGLGSWGLWEAVEGWEVLLPLKVGWGK